MSLGYIIYIYCHSCGYSNVIGTHEIDSLHMVGIAPIKMVMTGGWFMALLYPCYSFSPGF